MPDDRDGWIAENATACTMRLAYPGQAPWGAAYVVHGAIDEVKYQEAIDLSDYSRMVVRVQSANASRVRIGVKEAKRKAGAFYPQVEKTLSSGAQDVVIPLSDFRRFNPRNAYVVIELQFVGSRPQTIDVQSVYFER
jgi:hypothetical protein